MTIEIRAAKTEEDFQLIKDMTQYAFYRSPGSIANRDKTRPYFQGDHEFLLYVDETPVATAASIPMKQNIRGKVFDMAGIAGIFTYPEFRRQGHVNRLMVHMFKTMINKKQPITALYPFKESFYGRYGYVTLPQTMVAEIDSAKLRKLINFELPITYKRYELKEDYRRVIQMLEHFQHNIHGMATFNPEMLEYLKEIDSWVVEILQDGECTGLIIYKNKGFVEPAEVRAWFYQTPEAKYGIIRYFALHAEQISTLNLPIYNGEHLEQLWFDLTPVIKSRKWVPSAMGRVALVGELGGIQVGEGEIHLEISDKYIAKNNHCWLFSSQSGILNVEKCLKTHEISKSTSITIEGLSALVFGGYQVEDFELRGWGTLSPQEIAKLQLMFPPVISRIFQTF